MDQSPDDGLSIGQQDPSRDQAMEREQFRQDSEHGHGAEPFERPEEQRRKAAGKAPDRPVARRG